VEEIQRRYEEARETSRRGGYVGIFDEFESRCSKSSAVICRGLSAVMALVSSDNELYTTFYKQVEATSRIPEDNRWDRNRAALESAMFPHYHTEINYGALSLTGAGHTAYGPYAVTLRDVAIRDRASVFQEPLFPFFSRHKIVAGTDIPPGYRATWWDRGRLAAAKHGKDLTPSTHPQGFQDLLLPPDGDTEGDCIEVHVYGPIHRRAIERVIGSKPKRKADRILLKSLSARLEEVGAKWETME
jgi:hypothetical protein